jgi:hypothetical protein
MPIPPGARVTAQDSSVDVSWALLALMWIVLGSTAFRTVADPDLWGHLRFGLDVLSSHHLPAVDSYSFTQDVPWVNHEWLGELSTAIAYRIGGSVGLVWLKALLVLLAFLVVATAFSRTMPVAVCALLLVIVAWAWRPVTLTLRPQLWTLLLLSVLCRVLTQSFRVRIVAVPALFLFWVNLHGGWIVGLGVLAVWEGCQAVRLGGGRAAVGRVAAIIGVALLATLVNPYGWRMWGFLIRTVRISRDITEWQPLWAASAAVWLPIFMTALIAAFRVFSAVRPTIERMAVSAMLAFGAVRVMRIGPLFVAATMILLAPSLSEAARAIPGRLRTLRAPSTTAAWLSVIPAICVIAVAAREVASASRCIPIAGDWIPDAPALVALRDGEARGNLVTWFSWGEYALWHLAPKMKVSIDGRRETLYSDVTLLGHEAFYRGDPAGLAFIDGLKPDYVWLPDTQGHTKSLLASRGFRLDVDDGVSFIAVRSGLERVRLPASYSSTASTARCFPGP